MYHFIVNDHGGSGKAFKTWLKVQHLLEHDNISYECHHTQYEGHATVITRELTAEKEDVFIIVVGGDGTINEVINGIINFDNTYLGIIPTGSGNDFARGLNIPKSTKEAFHKIIISSKTKKIDLGYAQYFTKEDLLPKEHLFGISSGIGMDALVCKKAHKSRQKKLLNGIGLGKLTYILITIQTLFSMEYSDIELTVNNTQKLVSRLIFMAFMNCRAEGGGVNMAPSSKVDDGLISLCGAYDVSRLKSFYVFAKLVKKNHKELKNFVTGDADNIQIKINNSKLMAFHTDGEYLGDVSAVNIKCLKHKLNILI